jgi:hypothetical protein
MGSLEPKKFVCFCASSLACAIALFLLFVFTIFLRNLTSILKENAVKQGSVNGV